MLSVCIRTVCHDLRSTPHECTRLCLRRLTAVTCDGTSLTHTNAATLASGTEGASEAYGSSIVYTCDAGFTGSLTFTCGDAGFASSDVCSGMEYVPREQTTIKGVQFDRGCSISDKGPRCIAVICVHCDSCHTFTQHLINARGCACAVQP
jgi:hypothetical protein